MAALRTNVSLLAVVFSLSTLANAEPPRIPCEELRRAQLLKEANLTVIDARQSVEFFLAHIQNASNIPGGEVGTGELSHEGRIVVYCDDFPCTLSVKSAEKLIGLGYSNTFVLDGGLGEWQRRGYPVVKGAVLDGAVKAESLSAEKARPRIEAGTLQALDVRPPLEFKAGRVPGAKNVPLDELETELAYLSKEVEYLVYDRLSTRSRKAVETLVSAGFKIFELQGGLAGWVQKEYSLEVK